MANQRKPPATAPIILFPLAGCEPAGALTQAQYEVKMRVLRETVRSHWTNAGVQALIELMEMHAAGLQGAAIGPAANAHDAGQAFGAARLIALARGVVGTMETDDEDAETRRRRRAAVRRP